MNHVSGMIEVGPLGDGKSLTGCVHNRHPGVQDIQRAEGVFVFHDEFHAWLSMGIQA